MAGFNFFGYLIHPYLKDAFGYLGLRDVSEIRGHSYSVRYGATTGFGAIDAYGIYLTRRSVGLRLNHLFGDEYQWAPIES